METKRYQMTPAIYMLIVRNGKVLLLRRQNTGYQDGKWGLPSGHLNENERATDAVIRECQEEVGVTVLLRDLKHVHTMFRRAEPGCNNGSSYVDSFFVTKKWNGTPENREPNKCSEIAWFDLDHLPDDTVPCVRHAIACILRNQTFSEFGWD